MTEIKLRRGTAANWTSVNPTLALGEPGFETDTGQMKIGNGTSAWVDLPYFLNEEGLAINYATKDASSLNTGTLDDERLNDRLGVYGEDLATALSNNWNNVVETGFYWAQGTQTNAPSNNPFMGTCYVIDSSNQIQTLHRIAAGEDTSRSFYRVKSGGVWGSWYALDYGWQSFTPALTNLTKGNGTLEAFYQRIGKTINFRIKFVFGSTSAAPGGAFNFGLPANAEVGASPIGTAHYRDSADGGRRHRFVRSTTGAGACLLQDQDGASVTDASRTWAAGDEIMINGTYESA